MKSKKLFGLGLAALASVTVVGGTIAAQDMTSVLAAVPENSVSCNIVLDSKTLVNGTEKTDDNGTYVQYEVNHVLFNLHNVTVDAEGLHLTKGSKINLSHDVYDKDKNVGGVIENIEHIDLVKTTQSKGFEINATLGNDKVDNVTGKFNEAAFFSGRNTASWTFTAPNWKPVIDGARYFGMELTSGNAVFTKITFYSYYVKDAAPELNPNFF